MLPFGNRWPTVKTVNWLVFSWIMPYVIILRGLRLLGKFYRTSDSLFIWIEFRDNYRIWRSFATPRSKWSEGLSDPFRRVPLLDFATWFQSLVKVFKIRLHRLSSPFPTHSFSFQQSFDKYSSSMSRRGKSSFGNHCDILGNLLGQVSQDRSPSPSQVVPYLRCSSCEAKT